MVQQDLIDSIEKSYTDMEEKTASKESKIEKRAMDTKELASTNESKAADEFEYNFKDDNECGVCVNGLLKSAVSVVTTVAVLPFHANAVVGKR